jgi:hypothetical protein
MPARMTQLPPSDYRPAGTTDCCIECPEHESEWAWGAPVATIERLIGEHNAAHHASSNTRNQEDDRG